MTLPSDYVERVYVGVLGKHDRGPQPGNGQAAQGLPGGGAVNPRRTKTCAA